MKVAITGGHHTSALPVIDELKNKISDIELVWFGHRHSMKGNKNDTLEYGDITTLGIPFIDLKAGKFYKTLDPIRLLKIPFGFFQALYHLFRMRPDVILSFGGYLAVPVVIAGWFLGIPAVTHEQTVVSGYANKLIAKFAKKILVSWEESAKHFPQGKVLYTGLPLRRELFEVSSDSFDINPDLPTIYITAGKTGSHKINLVVKEVLPKLLEVCNVIHQCGSHSEFNDHDALAEIYEGIDGSCSGKYFLRRFVLNDEIGEVFAKAGLFVCRAGAHTVKEILTFKKQAILIPIPWVSHNEQFENAKLVEQAGLGAILEESDLNPVTLLDVISSKMQNISTTSGSSITYDGDSSAKIIESLLLVVPIKKE